MKISIITATWNSALTIVDTLKSLNSQDYEDIEHIIVDGGSTDDTLKLVKLYKKNPLTIITESDQGIYDALNKGISTATGDVIGFLHSDDIFFDTNVLTKVAGCFVDNIIDATYGDLEYVSKSDTSKIVRKWKSGDYNKNKFKNGWMPPHPTFYMRRQKYIDLGGFNLKYKISADYDSMLRYLWSGNIKPEYIPSVLIRMRTGGTSNRSFINIVKKTIEDKTSMSENNIPIIRGLLGKNLLKIPQFFIKKLWLKL
jgi:glycosyltransferase